VPLVDACADLYRQGWAENHAGNVSIRLNSTELAAFDLGEGRELPLAEPVPELAGESYLVTAAGSAFRLLVKNPELHAGVVTVSQAGDVLRVRWGFEDGGRPTSELPAHLRSHVARRTSAPDSRVVLHCHPTHVVAMTHVHELDEISFTRALWATNSESILATPRGVGLLPWMVCGTDTIGIESAAKLRDHEIVVWAKHGVLAAGPSLQSVIGVIESVEKSAETWLLTRGERDAISLPELRDLADAFGIVPPAGYLELEDVTQ
jgi:rhamnulose-1-phosphate aldolase